MFEIFNNKLFLLTVLCFLIASCNGSLTGKRYRPRDFVLTYWNGNDVNSYLRPILNIDNTQTVWGEDITQTQKFCWRWVKAMDGSNYKMVTIEEGNSNLSTDDNTGEEDQLQFPYQLRNDFESPDISLAHAFFKPILVNINTSTYEISTPSPSGHNFILIGIQEFLSPHPHYPNGREDLDITPEDFVGTNSYLTSINGDTKFRSRTVKLNKRRFKVLTLEVCNQNGCY